MGSASISARRAITLSPLPTSATSAGFQFIGQQADAAALQPVADTRGGGYLLQRELRVLVQLAPPANQLLFKAHGSTSALKCACASRRRELGAPPVANGRVDDKFVDVPGRLQGVQLRFNLFGVPNSSADSRRAMRVGLLPAWRAKAAACASLPTVTRWPFSSSTPHTSTLPAPPWRLVGHR
jgi:hypothetical protein